MAARSIGGGMTSPTGTMVLGGVGSGDGGKVTVNANASISASGIGATTVYAQGSGDPIIDVAAGVGIVGGPGGTAITRDGPENSITNYCSLFTAAGATDRAIATTTGFAVVTNGGAIRGDLSLAAGQDNLLHNLSTGILSAGHSPPPACCRPPTILRLAAATSGARR
ncbi:hypothetical protein [Ancylobacter sonchi]